MSKHLEEHIIAKLLHDKKFSNTVITYTKPEYFQNHATKTITEHLLRYATQYNTLPVKASLLVEIDKMKGISSEQYNDLESTINRLYSKDTIDSANKGSYDYDIEQTEKYFINRSMFNAVMDAAMIIEGKNKKLTQDAIPDLMREALSVSFDTSIGHSYFADAKLRKEEEELERIPFKQKILNVITNGGVPKKTLTVVAATSGAGKSMFMSDWAAFLVKLGYNVLYFSMELSEKELGKRIDANLLNYPINKIPSMENKEYYSKLDSIAAKTHGEIKIKEFPAGSASVNDFRRVMKELQLKKNFKPDIVFVDYLGICASARLKAGDANSYAVVKAVSEEVRGLGQEYDIPIVSASQVNRGGYSNDNVGMENLSDSMGIAHTADVLFALYSNDELKEQGKVILTQLKNRLGDKDKYKKVALGQDGSRMSFYELTEDEKGFVNDAEYRNNDDMKALDTFSMQVDNFETLDFN